MDRTIRSLCFAGLLLAMSAHSALADQIDGTWCAPTGESMTIEGPRVVIPGGKVLQGRYDRHNFSYDVPAGEVNAGGRVDANQIDDQHIRVTTAPAAQTEPAPHAIWTRCDVVS